MATRSSSLQAGQGPSPNAATPHIQRSKNDIRTQISPICQQLSENMTTSNSLVTQYRRAMLD
jgi:hypothetical protein